MKWSTFPFLKITSAFVVGILLSGAYNFGEYSRYFLMLFVIFFSYHTYLLLRSGNYGINNISGTVGFVLLGYLSAQLTDYAKQPLLSSDSFAEVSFYKVIINSKPVSTSKTTKYLANIECANINESWIPVDTEAILYFKDDVSIDFKYGDKLLIKGHPSYLENQKNPHAFDYALYLQRRGVYLNDFISKNEFVLTNSKSSLKYFNHYVGDYFENILADNISTERELNMVKAMLLGRREAITPEMKYVYASSGTAHILAVSGLHVGIIYFIFSTLLRFLKTGKLRLIYFGITLCGIWSFAFITGLSPSVLRASVMISFILMASLIGRKSNIYNTILASAFFMLLYDPNLIFSVSFQLSYVAVFGIIFFYKKIYTLIFVPNKLLNFFWQITAISFSVQIATFPITIHYFNQFPVLFPLTNLLAIPTAIATIIGGLLILASSPISLASGFFGNILEGWVYIYNEILISISTLPVATVEDLYLKPSYVFLIIICVIFLSSFLFTKRFIFFRYFSVAIVFLSAIIFIDHYMRSQQREIVFYESNFKNYFDIFLGNDCYTNIISSNEKLKSQVRFSISPNRKYHLIENVHNLGELEMIKEIEENILIRWEGKSILILSKYPDNSINYAGISIDYLVIGKNLVQELSKLENLIKIKNLILDSTIDIKTSKMLLDLKHNSNMKIYSISMEGAYSIVI